MIPIEYDSGKFMNRYETRIMEIFNQIPGYLSRGYIGNLNNVTKKQFSSAYTKTDKPLKPLFKKLFTGGQSIKSYQGPYRYSEFVIDDRTRLFLRWLMYRQIQGTS